MAERLCLLGVDGFHEHSLVLELVSLGGKVQLVVKVAVDLLRLPVLAEQAAEHALATHPEHLEGHTCIHATLALTVPSVTSLGLGSHVSLVTGLGVDGVLLLAGVVGLDELAHALAGGGVGDLAGLIGVEPHLGVAQEGWWGGGGGWSRGEVSACAWCAPRGRVVQSECTM